MTRPQVTRILWGASLLAAFTTLFAWVFYWTAGDLYIVRPLFVATDRHRDLINYIEKIKHLNDGAAALARGMPVFNYPAPAAYVYQFFLVGFPHHAERTYLFFLGATALALSIVAWRACQAGRRGNSGAAAAIVTIALLGSPLWFTADRANIEGVVWAFSAAGLCLFLQGQYTWASVLIGAAASVKPFPILFLLLLLRRRRYKEAVLGCAVAAALFVAALAALGPNPLQAYRDMSPGIARYIDSYVTKIVPPDEARFDHSLLDGMKSVAVVAAAGSVESPKVEEMQLKLSEISARPPLQRLVRLYSPVAAVIFISLCAVFYKSPLLNQLTALSVAVTLLPLSASEYTLLHLYVAFGAFLVFLVRDVAVGKAVFSIRSAVTIASVYALLFSPLTFLNIYTGDAKLLLLIALLYLIARSPMKSTYFADPAMR